MAPPYTMPWSDSRWWEFEEVCRSTPTSSCLEYEALIEARPVTIARAETERLSTNRCSINLWTGVHG